MNELYQMGNVRGGKVKGYARSRLILLKLLIKFGTRTVSLAY